MPGWEETENEIRYRIRDPDLFSPDSFFVKDLQESPRNYAVFGKLKGEESSKIQALRFPKNVWTMDEAKKWYEPRKEDLGKSALETVPENAKYAGVNMAEFEKMEADKAKSSCKKSEDIQKAEVDTVFLEKSNLMVQSLSFTMGEFTEKSVKEWLVSKNMDVSTIKKSPTSWMVEIRPEPNFIQGSLRDIILKQGIKATVGLLKKEQISKKVPDRFAIAASALNELFDLDITEVTLTRAPILGKMSEFRIIKGQDSTNEYSACVPILKVSDDTLMRVGAYPLVPNLPDWVGDIVSPKEVEDAAHRFMQNLAYKMQQGTGSAEEHKDFENIGYPIESYIDQTGINGVPGGWWLETQVTNQDTWRDIKKGEIIGYSIGGAGRRKKLNVSIDTPVTKSEDIADTVVNKLSKLFGFRKDEPKQEPAITQVIKKENLEEAKNNMKLELLQKYDLKPSEAEILEKSGVNLEEALAGTEKLFKAISFNFSLEGIGYTTKKLIEIIRRGEFGEWPTGNSWMNGVSKAQPKNEPPAPTTQQPTQPAPVTKSDDLGDVKKSISDMTTAMQSVLSCVEGLGARLSVVENARGIRKSLDSDPVDVPPQAKNTHSDLSFDSMDRHNLSYRKNKQILKEQGIA